MIDHRELLRKYIVHIGNEEGLSFLNDWHRGPTLGGKNHFTDEEWAELKSIERIAE